MNKQVHYYKLILLLISFRVTLLKKCSFQLFFHIHSSNSYNNSVIFVVHAYFYLKIQKFTEIMQVNTIVATKNLKTQPGIFLLLYTIYEIV